MICSSRDHVTLVGSWWCELGNPRYRSKIFLKFNYLLKKNRHGLHHDGICFQIRSSAPPNKAASPCKLRSAEHHDGQFGLCVWLPGIWQGALKSLWSIFGRTCQYVNGWVLYTYLLALSVIHSNVNPNLSEPDEFPNFLSNLLDNVFKREHVSGDPC